MSMIAGLAMICDISFYFSLLGMARLLMNASGLMLLVPMIMGLAAGLGHALGARKDGTRYLPLLLLLLCIPIANGMLEMMLLIPPAVYLAFTIKGNRRIIDYYFAFTRFRSSFALLMLVVLFVIFITGSEVWLKTLPYMFLYFVLSINLLRMLRHDARTISQWRFRIVNLSSTAGVCAAGVLFSTGIVLKALRAVGLAMWGSVLRPVVSWCVDAVAFVMKLVHDLVSMLPWSYESADMSTPMNNMIEVNYNQPSGEEVLDNINQYPAVKYVLMVLGIAVGAVIFLSVMKMLSRQRERVRDNDLGDSREKLEKTGGKRGGEGGGVIARRRDPALGARYYYRKFLAIARSRGQAITAFQNSLQIEQGAQALFPDREALSGLRQVYIRARYCGEPLPPEDAAAAKAAYDKLKKKPE